MTNSRTVLVVEDETALAGLLVDVLQSAGYEVVVTTAGHAAARAASALPVAIVIDYLMPGMNGAEVIKKIRQTGGIRFPTILVTGLANARELAAEAGADAYLRKPFDVDALVQLVNELALPNV